MHIFAAIDASLTRLGTDYVDLYLQRMQAARPARGGHGRDPHR